MNPKSEFVLSDDCMTDSLNLADGDHLCVMCAVPRAGKLACLKEAPFLLLAKQVSRP